MLFIKQLTGCQRVRRSTVWRCEAPEIAFEPAAAAQVALIRPPFVTTSSSLVGAQAHPSLALALLGAVCIAMGYAVTAIDATGERFDQYLPLRDTGYFSHGLTAQELVARIPRDTNVIGVTCMFSNEWLYHRHVVDRISQEFPDVPFVLGGEHATAGGEYVLNSCPGVWACVIGEGEDTLGSLYKTEQASTY